MCACAKKAQIVLKNAKPVLSLTPEEAHQRVLGLYRAFYRYIPYLLKYHDIPKTELDCRWMLREKFYKNACVRDLRMIDILVMKGYMEYKELTHQWQQKTHVMNHWKPSQDPPPRGFLCKFLAGND